MTKTETDVFPLISESIASMRDPQRFTVGEYVLVVSHCSCWGGIQLHPGKVVALGTATHKVALMQLGCVLKVAVYDIIKADAVEDSDEL